MSKLKSYKYRIHGEDKIFKHNPEVTETFDGKIKLGQRCSFTIGSDRYTMQVKHISNTGKKFISDNGMVFRSRPSSFNEGEFYWLSGQHYFFDERTDLYMDPSF